MAMDDSPVLDSEGNDDHVAQECLDFPQSLVVIVSGVWCTAGCATAGHARLWIHVHNLELVVAAS